MKTWPRLIGTMLLAAVMTAAAGGEAKPAWQRSLQGEEAKKAAELAKQIAALETAGKYAEAIPAATAAMILRRQGQGDDHWETADARHKLETLRRLAALTGDQQRRYVEAQAEFAKAMTLDRRGQLAEAERLFRQLLVVYEETLGANQLTAIIYGILAYNLDRQGKRAAAEPYYRKSLTLCEEALGPKHPLAAQSHYNLAHHLLTRGYYNQAEPHIRNSLAIREEVLGPRHPLTAESYNNLAFLFNSLNKHGQAEPLFRKALAIWEGAGPSTLGTASASNNLASNLNSQGKHEEAESYYRQALAIRQKLSPGSQDTGQSFNGLAFNLVQQGRYAEAELLYRQALAIYEKFGPFNLGTAISYNNLAFALDHQGRHVEAEPLYRQSLAIYDQAGAQSLYKASGYSYLASNLDYQGKHAEAEPLFRQALTIRKKLQGLEHPNTATAYFDLASNLNSQGRHGEAEPLNRQAMTVYEKVYGAHPFTATSYHGLGTTLQAWGKHAEAEAFYRQALTIYEKKHGPRHPQTASSYHALAANFQVQGRFEEAEPLYRRALAIRELVLGQSHVKTASSCSGLAANLMAQGKYSEAEPYWRAAVKGFEVARLHLAATGFDRAIAAPLVPHFGLARCLAQLGKPGEAWQAAEAGLARGLLDDLAARTILPEDNSRRDRAARLTRLEKLLLPLLTPEQLTPEKQNQRQELTLERSALLATIDQENSELARREVLPLDRVQKQLAADGALVFWIDHQADAKAKDSDSYHWACLVRHRGPPAWVRLPGTGPGRTWTSADDTLPVRLRVALAGRSADWSTLAGRLFAQRLAPLEARLAATADLPEVKRLIVVPAGWMAGVPLEVLSKRWTFSYAPSGTIFARLVDTLRPLQELSLLALGDPSFTSAEKAEKSQYGNLKTEAKVSQAGNPADLSWKALLASTRGPTPKQLPGTRREIAALARLFPKTRALLLLGSEASEQKLDELARAGRLKDFRVLHLATHGHIDPQAASRSALLLARDQLPDGPEQARRGRKVYTGRLTVATVAHWHLDADLVTLSACETALGQHGGGEGFLGFAQVLFKAGARSLLLSQWKVDDAATALLMMRFYENLLGRRDGLTGPLDRAAALREAQTWLRELPRSEAERLTAELSKDALRGTIGPLRPLLPSSPTEDRPYAHPFYWSAFILLGAS